jgi:hypothetical protein
VSHSFLGMPPRGSVPRVPGGVAAAATACWLVMLTVGGKRAASCLPSAQALPGMQALTVALCCCRVLAQLPLLSALHLGHCQFPSPTARAAECPPHERPLLRSLAHLSADQFASLDAIMHATEVAMPPVCMHRGRTGFSPGMLVVKGCSGGWLRSLLHPRSDRFRRVVFCALSDDEDVAVFAGAAMLARGHPGVGDGRWEFALGKAITTGGFKQLLAATGFPMATVAAATLRTKWWGQQLQWSWEGDLKLTGAHFEALVQGRRAAEGRGGWGGCESLQLHDCSELSDALLVALVGPELRVLSLEQAGGLTNEGLREVGERCRRLQHVGLAGLSADVTAAGLVGMRFRHSMQARWSEGDGAAERALGELQQIMGGEIGEQRRVKHADAYMRIYAGALHIRY